MADNGVRIEQEHSSILASTHVDIDIDPLRTPGETITAPLEPLMRSTIQLLEQALAAHTEPGASSTNAPDAPQP